MLKWGRTQSSKRDDEQYNYAENVKIDDLVFIAHNVGLKVKQW